MRLKHAYHARAHLPGGSDRLLRNEIGFYTVEPNVGNPTSGKQIMAWTFAGTGAGAELLHTSSPSASATGPAIITPGMYVINARVGADPSPLVDWPADSNGSIDLFVNAEPSPEYNWGQQATLPFPLDGTGATPTAATGFTRYLTNQAAGFNQFLQLYFYGPGTYEASGFVSVQRIY